MALNTITPDDLRRAANLMDRSRSPVRWMTGDDDRARRFRLAADQMEQGGASQHDEGRCSGCGETTIAYCGYYQGDT